MDRVESEMQPSHRPRKYFLKSDAVLSYKNSCAEREASLDYTAPVAAQLPTRGIRAPKYAALATPTTPITALKITQIHGLQGISPISNNGVILAHAA